MFCFKLENNFMNNFIDTALRVKLGIVLINQSYQYAKSFWTTFSLFFTFHIDFSIFEQWKATNHPSMPCMMKTNEGRLILVLSTFFFTILQYREFILGFHDRKQQRRFEGYKKALIKKKQEAMATKFAVLWPTIRILMHLET